MTSYFMRRMSICAKLGLNFLCNFHKTTYKRPIFCNTCGGFASVNCGGSLNRVTDVEVSHTFYSCTTPTSSLRSRFTSFQSSRHA
ncbi:hypothetical protein SKAU_G00087320 [Synaphobranchus kaupii]|uniref:Uncharacterized protein n=1 Tax=Synaphobranchus kaupii TaxID=118154 RepID=A0A9Q1J5S9_SYNKA|nr:hypothetical protein SKAU_G00087320 [Synaphobranchus kaupii]